MTEQLEEEGWVVACEASEVPEAMPRLVEVAGREVLICRSSGEFFAVDEICPHENKSMRFAVVFDGRIICPHHQYAFKLDSGSCNRRKCAPVMTYDCKLVDGTVYVRPPR